MKEIALKSVVLDNGAREISTLRDLSKEMDEICTETCESLLTQLTGTDEHIPIVDINPYTLEQTELTALLVDLLLVSGHAMVSIWIDSIEGNESIGDTSHVYNIIRLSKDRFMSVQTYAGFYHQRKYKELNAIDLIIFATELHVLYTFNDIEFVRAFYRKWFYVDLERPTVPNSLRIFST